MVRKELLLAGALTVAGLAGGYWLLPREADVARMEVRDYNYQDPERHYEEKFAAGDHSTETVQQLVRIHTSTGEIDRAIAVLEIYVKEHPEDDKALKQLGQLYQFAQRYQDYMNILISRAKEGDDPVVLSEMSQLYNFFQQPDKQKETLIRLHKVENGANPQTIRDLAIFYALDKEFEKVAALSDELLAKHAAEYKYEDTVAHTNALLEIKKPDNALKVVEQWTAMPQAKPEEIAFLVDMLHYQASPDYAKRVMAGISQEKINASPDLLHSHLLLILAEGKRQEAYETLSNLYEKGQLPDLLLPDLMYMAAAEGNTKRFHALRERAGLTRLPESQLADIWTIARRGKQTDVMRAIRLHVNESSAEDYPLLRAMIYVDERSPARHAAVRTLLEQSLDNESLLKLAEATAEAGDMTYTRQILAKLPAIKEMRDTEIASLENIYLLLNDVGAAKQFVADLREAGRIDASSEVGLRTAAAVGDASVLRDWHKAHGAAASESLVNDLFYQASNHNHLQLALEIINWQDDPRQKAFARRSISDIYSRLGRYGEALALVENEAPRNERELQDRVFLLSKLAPHSAARRQQLQALSRQWFNKPKLSRDSKEDIIYALLGIGDKDAALPYMQQMANQYGGEWTLTYAYALTEAGRSSEAVEYYVKAAQDPKLSTDTKLDLAYALADGGNRIEAEKLLGVLADNPSTQMQAAEQLAYLWGPRPTQEQVEWLLARWEQSEGAEKAKYAELLAGKMTPDMLAEQVHRNPQLRAVPEIDEGYLVQLAEEKGLRPEIDATAKYARETGNVGYLLKLAELAREYGAYKEARIAYDTVIEVNPNNVPALLGATINAGEQANYAGIPAYFERYLKQAEQPPLMATSDIHEAYFHYAEELRRRNELQRAKPYYQQTVAFVEQSGMQSAQALSIAAQSAAWLQEQQKSDQLYALAFEQYPDNAIIRADKASLQVERQQYKEARVTLAGIKSLKPAPKELDVALLTASDTGSAQQPELLDNGRQLLVRVAPETEGKRFWVSNLRAHPAVNYVTEGYDSVLIVTKLGHTFEISQPQNGWMVTAVEDANTSIGSESSQLALRTELLQTRMDLETGKLESASNRIEALEKTYSEDPQYLGFAANTQYYSEMWPAAKANIEKAHAISPDNADITRLKRDIDRNYPDHARADITLTNRGDNSELMTSVGGESHLHGNWRAGGVVRNHYLDVQNELQPNGVISDRSGNRQTLHLYGIHSDSGNDMWKVHVFANNDTAGVGADYSFINRLGITTLGARYHEPYFEFVEGILDDAVRDRVAINHVVKPATDWEVGVGGSLNRYSIDVEEDVMSTAGVDVNVSHAIQQAGPYIGVGYGLTAEYELDNEFQETVTGQSYRRLPLRSREIHFGSVNVAHDFSDKTYGSVLAGYGWDRLGGHGPAVEGAINHELYKDWDVGARAFYGLNASASNEDNLSQLNGYVRYRF